jgi:restriction system protein
MSITPDEYEHLVASMLRGEGWEATVTPASHDFGLDVIAVRAGIRLGVQAKMYLAANRPVNAATVMLTYGAAAYADCSRCMIVTDGRILDDA